MPAPADRYTGALGLVLATSYVSYARNIEDSLLADAVGAAGVPTGVGVALGLASAALFIKSWRGSPAKAAPQDFVHPAPAQAQAVAPAPLRPHLQALGLLAILMAYTALLPVVGYVLSIGLLIGAVAWFAGARGWRTLAACAVLGGLALWFMFAVALSVRMPLGLWASWVRS